jgi:peptide/nickel transport system ATP-binding protein
MNRLEVNGLNIGYRKTSGEVVPAVRRVNFTLKAGMSLGIVGESGSGKSTVARALLGHCRPGGVITSGAVRMAGQDILALPEAERRALRGRHIAFVPQNPLSSLTPHLRIGDQVLEAVRHLRGFDKERARARVLELFEATNLPKPQELYERYPHQLSGGQRQRVVIAAALAGEPELLVLDEPTTALDKTTEAQVLELVRVLRERFNASLVYVSHDLGMVSRMCDRVIVMHQGRIVEEGAASTIFSAPSHGYTRQLIAAIPRIDAPVAERPMRQTDSPPVLEARHLRFSYGATGGWFRRARAEAPVVLEDLSFTIRRGETLGLVGESGSGKSTAAALVAGMLSTDQGSMAFNGKPLPGLATQRPLALRRQIQIVFQDPLSSLNPRQRIETILSRPLAMFEGLKGNAARARCEELMRDMHLSPDLLECYPRQLSGGQQQRVAIARAFAARPELIICDEVTSALDVSVQAQVLDLLMELQRSKGTSYLFITHDLGVIRRMADHLIVLQNGRVRESGPTEQVFDRPQSPYTRLLLDAASLHAVQPLAQAVSRHRVSPVPTSSHETDPHHRSTPGQARQLPAWP